MIVDPLPVEMLDKALEHVQIMKIALRKCAAAAHRVHANDRLVSWQNCPEHICQLAHDALDGKLRLGPTAPSVGRPVSVVRCD